LSQAGADAVGALINHFSPAAGLVSRVAAEGIAGIAGSVAGTVGGRHIGRALGDKSPQQNNTPGESIVRGVAGTAAQIGFPTAARAVGAAIGTAADPFIGPAGTILGGAAAGLLADEGADLLYRHLGRYGNHVPKMAASKLGYRGPPPMTGKMPKQPQPISGAAA
jgi:hypothetical protein